MSKKSQTRHEPESGSGRTSGAPARDRATQAGPAGPAAEEGGGLWPGNSRARTDATDFQLATERTEKELAISARESLIRAAAHDLRSPLNGIQSWVHVLAGRVQDAPGAQRALAGIQNAVEQQVRLIETMSEALRIMNGSLCLRWQAASLSRIVAAQCARVADDARDRGVSLLAPESGVEVEADVDTLGEALRVVLAYMMRTAPTGEQVDIDVSRQSDRVLLWLGAPAGAAGVEGDAAAFTDSVPSGLVWAQRLIELNGGRLLGMPLDDHALHWRFLVCLRPPGLERPEGDEMPRLRREAAARAQADLGGLDLALVRGAGWEDLLRTLSALGARPRVLAAAQWPGEIPRQRCDLVLLPADLHDPADPGILDVPCLVYGGGVSVAGQDGARKPVARVLPPTSEPLRMAAAIRAACRPLAGL